MHGEYGNSSSLPSGSKQHDGKDQDDDEIVFPDNDSEIQNDLQELDDWQNDPIAETPGQPDYYADNISTSQKSNQPFQLKASEDNRQFQVTDFNTSYQEYRSTYRSNNANNLSNQNISNKGSFLTQGNNSNGSGPESK